MRKLYTACLMVCLLAMNFLAFSQNRSVTGTVKDANGDGIPGVSVRIKNSNKGTVTNGTGDYKIEAASGSVLVFSGVGYVPQEVKLGSSSTVDVALADDVANLEEVVVSGLATNVKRGNLANAVATLSAKDLMGTTTPITTDGAMQGKLAGANIMSNGSMPGGGFNMQFRGVSTLGSSGSQPLIIVDGVYIDNSQSSVGRSQANKATSGTSASAQDNNANRLADLNPDDIERIEVLKGASAAAIYGTGANAGVVIITTKKGKGGKTKVSFGQDLGQNSAYAYYGGATWDAAKVESIYGKDAVKDFNAGTINNYEKEIFGNKGLITNTRLSFTGGNEKTSFYVNGSLNDETGIVKNTGFQRASIRANIDNKVTNWLDLGFNGNFIRSENDRGWTGNDNSNINYGYNIPYNRPWENLYPNAQGVYPNSSVGENPLAIRDRAVNNQVVNRFIGGINFTARAINNEKQALTFKLTSGTDYQSGTSLVYLPSDLQSQLAEANPGYAQDTRTEFNNYNVQLSGVHTYTVNDLNFTTSVGAVQWGRIGNENYVRGRGLPAGVYNPGRARTFAQDVFYTKVLNQGIFGQEEVNYKDMIIAAGGIRFDRSTLNGDPNQFAAFPRASLALNANKFGSWAANTPISQLKLRVAYGETAGFANFGALYNQLEGNGVGGVGGLQPSGIYGNPNLFPERAAETEFGVDFGLFKGRVTGEITKYNKKVIDLIQPLTTAPTTGVTSTSVNAANLINRGWEITLGADVVKKDNFSWFVQPIYWLNRSEITRLDIPERLTGGFGATFGQWRIKQGYSPTQIVGQPRTLPATDPNYATSWTVYGDQQPKFEFSLNQRLTLFKNFEVSFLGHYRHKFTVVSLARVLWDEGGNTSDWNGTELSGDGTANGLYRQNVNGLDENGVPKPGYNPVQTSFFKLREAAAYYRLPKKVLTSAFKGNVSGAKIGFSGNNLFRWTDYTAGYDPENSNFGTSALGSGVDIGSAPLVKRMMFHLTLDF